jgi:hypothetical protein
MEKQIEKAIKETLVISNPQSIHLAVKKILLLLNDSVEFCDCEPHTFYEWEKDENKCSQCGKKIY